jgi:Secretion system C-terminal sorting domain
MLNLFIPANLGSRQRIEVFNMQGQVVISTQLQDINEARLNITGLDHGVYYIRVTAENGQVAGIKFMKN